MSEEVLGIDVGGLGFVGTSTGDINANGEPVSQWWSIGRLWRLAGALPYQEVPLAELLFLLDEPSNFVAGLGGQIMRNRDVAEKARRIFEADLSYPVIIGADNWLMDGCHHIMKVYALGLPTIRVVRFDPIPAPDRVCSAGEFTRQPGVVVF